MNLLSFKKWAQAFALMSSLALGVAWADTLRWALAHTASRPPEYRAGFLDGIGAFVS